jgi:hypothetical protein
VATPYDSFTLQNTGVDPGRDNIIGTADDKTVTIFAVPRTFAGFGQINERIVNASGDFARNSYSAYGVTLNRQQANNWSLLMSFNADYRNLKNYAPRDPNEALYGPGSNGLTNGGATTGNPYQSVMPEWNYSFRTSGTYRFPLGFLYGTALTAQSGDWYGRDIQVRNGLNAVVNIRIEQQVARYPWVYLWDNRISKRVSLPKGQSIEAMFDLFNSLNINTVTSQVIRNGSTYGQPTDIIAPRVFRLGLRYRF